VSLLSPFRWLMESLVFIGASKLQLLLAVQFAVVVMFLPSLIQGLFGSSLGVQMTALGIGLAFTAPILVGVLRLFAMESEGKAFVARDALQIFQDRSRWAGSVGLHLINLLLMVILIGGVLSLFIGEAYLQQLMAAMQSATPGKPPQLPALPEGAATAIAICLLLISLLASVQYLSYTRYAQTSLGAIKCWVDALVAVLKNSAALLLFYLLAGFAALFVLAIVSAIILAIAGAFAAISPVLSALVLVPAYFILGVLVMYVMLGFYHRAHAEMFSEQQASANDTALV
jgi:hypothetical protein